MFLQLKVKILDLEYMSYDKIWFISSLDNIFEKMSLLMLPVVFGGPLFTHPDSQLLVPYLLAW